MGGGGFEDRGYGKGGVRGMYSSFGVLLSSHVHPWMVSGAFGNVFSFLALVSVERVEADRC